MTQALFGRAGSVRLWHNYLGMLIAPSVIFFSLTGALQMLNLHESHAGYHAPALLVVAASVHKDQKLPEHPGRDWSDDPAPHYTPAQALLKAYWIAMAAALTTSSILGVVLSLQNRLRRRTGVILLVLGTIVPLLLVLV